ncbi:hypothetical protein [Nocardia suismassiliense]|uniref:hypothetical protein n=1 Tax=Nocardia suismassiliense TaxID=2077092 RepID=UPI00131F23E8|nr:hypothetical protein [Nocardia suismassiliense]
MAHHVFKAAPDLDLYMCWSTVADGHVAIGDRARLLTYLRRHDGHSPAEAEAIMARADATGTSARPCPCTCTCTCDNDSGAQGDWNDSGVILDQRWLPRARFGDYMRAVLTDSPVDALLEDLDSAGDAILTIDLSALTCASPDPIEAMTAHTKTAARQRLP